MKLQVNIPEAVRGEATVKSTQVEPISPAFEPESNINVKRVKLDVLRPAKIDAVLRPTSS
jgi:hypothetical protein